MTLAIWLGIGYASLHVCSFWSHESIAVSAIPMTELEAHCTNNCVQLHAVS